MINARYARTSHYYPYIAGRGLRITGVATQILEIGGRLAIVVAAAYLLHIAISWLADYTVSRMSSRATSVDSQLVRLGFRPPN